MRIMRVWFFIFYFLIGRLYTYLEHSTGFKNYILLTSLKIIIFQIHSYNTVSVFLVLEKMVVLFMLILNSDWITIMLQKLNWVPWLLQLVVMIGIRKSLDFLFTRRELKILDDIMPETTKRTEEERRQLEGEVSNKCKI